MFVAHRTATQQNLAITMMLSSRRETFRSRWSYHTRRDVVEIIANRMDMPTVVSAVKLKTRDDATVCFQILSQHRHKFRNCLMIGRHEPEFPVFEL